MSESFSVRFSARKSRSNYDPDLSIYVRITVHGKRAEISLQRKIPKASWNPVSGRANGTKASIRTLNRYLDDVQAKLLAIQGNYVLKGRPYTARMIKEEFLGTSSKLKTLLKLYDEHNREIELLVGKEYSHGGYLRHTRTRRHLTSFIASEYRKDDIPLVDIDLRFIHRFEHYLKVLRIGAQNTVTKYITNLKKIVRIAYAHGYMDKDPFLNWKAKWKPVTREALTEHDLKTIIQKKFGMPRLNYVKDIFLFCCFTGLAYSDVKRLSEDHVVIGVNGQRWIKTNRSKTNTRTSVPILPMAEAILEKYKNHPKVTEKRLLLPVMSNQKLNAYLKEIADLCGISKRLTFHISRHTFATTVTLANGVPIESVSRMLGHQSLRTTQIYAKVLDNKIGRDMEAIRGKYSMEDSSKG